MTHDGLRAGVAVIKCTWGVLQSSGRYGPCGLAAVESHTWRQEFTIRPMHRLVCDKHAHLSRNADAVNGWPHMHHRLLQPTLATDEEVLMIEVMCHGLASLGVPR